jgi:hypothetical protein
MIHFYDKTRLARPFDEEGRVTRGDRAWLAGSLALSTLKARAAYLRQASEDELAGAPETDLSATGPHAVARSPLRHLLQALLAGGLLELDY